MTFFSNDSTNCLESEFLTQSLDPVKSLNSESLDTDKSSRLISLVLTTWKVKVEQVEKANCRYLACGVHRVTKLLHLLWLKKFNEH